MESFHAGRDGAKDHSCGTSVGSGRILNVLELSHELKYGGCEIGKKGQILVTDAKISYTCPGGAAPATRLDAASCSKWNDCFGRRLHLSNHFYAGFLAGIVAAP